MATANAIIEFEFTLKDGNNDLGTFSVDLNNLAGVDNVLNLFERIRSTSGLESVPASAVLEGLEFDWHCLLGIGEKGYRILSKLCHDLYHLRLKLTSHILNIDIQVLDINHLVGIETYNVSLKRQLEKLWPANETPESTTKHRYTNNGFFVSSEGAKKAFSNPLAEPVGDSLGRFSRVIREYHSKVTVVLGKPFGQFEAFEHGEPIVIDATQPFFHEALDQFRAIKYDERFWDIDHTVNGGNSHHKLTTTPSDGFERFAEKYKCHLEQFDLYKFERILEELDQFESIIEKFDQFDVVKLVESILDFGHNLEGRNACRRVFEAIELVKSTVEAGHTREGHNLCHRAFEATEFVKFIVDIGDALKGRNTCHSAFDVIELVKSTVDVGHAPRAGDTRKEIANGWHKCHPAEGIALGLTAGPCAVF